MGLPQPLTRRRVCPPPPSSGRKGILAGERGVGRVPIPTKGHTVWYSLYIRTFSISLTNTLYWSKESFLSLIGTRDTRNRDREKSSGQTHLFTIWTLRDMDRTSGQAQVKLRLFYHCIVRLMCVCVGGLGRSLHPCPPPPQPHYQLTRSCPVKTTLPSSPRSSLNKVYVQCVHSATK
jgi:hypothetical protein